MVICPLSAYHREMRLATVLLRLPLAILGEAIDLVFGPDELKGLTWPDTTTRVVDLEEATPVRGPKGFSYEIVHGSGW